MLTLMTLILILLIIAFAMYQYKKYDGKPFPYFIGSIFILLGALFIEPSPDPISFGIYALVHNTTYASLINPAVLPSVLWNFEIWSTIIGIIMVLIGMYLLKWNWKKLWNKINPGKYSISLMIAFGIVLLIAVLDIWSANSGIFGNLINYTSGNFGADWWHLFFKFVLIIFLIPGLCYYLLVHKDKSEALGIFLFSLILYFGGLSDIAYFVFQGLPVPATLPWLAGNPFINFISTTLGYASVTNVTLLFSVFISFILAWTVAKILKEKF